MRKLAMCALLLGGLGLGGCHSSDDPTVEAPKPLDKMSKEEWCSFYAGYLTRPNIADAVKQADRQKMRDRGCAVS